MMTLPMPQVLPMGLARRSSFPHEWTRGLTELTPKQAELYQLSRHPAMGLLSTRKPGAKAAPQPTLRSAPGRDR